MERRGLLISRESRKMEEPASQVQNLRIQPVNGSSSRNWDGLPPEILRSIFKPLDLIEQLSFCGVCKDWRAACFTSCSSSNAKLWFLLYQENDPECVLVRTDTGKKYKTHIPELDRSTCIASHSGWVLGRRIESNSIFFFYPFTRLSIDLPEIPLKNKDTSFIGAFSASPMRSDCVACVASNDEKSELELHVIRRGEETWTTHKPYNAILDVNKIKSMVYYDGGVHLFGDGDKLTEFSVKGGIWKYYRIITNPKERGLPMSFGYSSNGFYDDGLKEKLGLLGNGISVSTCGTIVGESFILNERVEEPSWDESEVKELKGVWIEPRFFPVSEDLTW